MKRKSAGIGLGVCLLLFVSANQQAATLSTGYLLADLSFLGSVIFLVLLLIGPSKGRRRRAIDKANQRLAAAKQAGDIADMAATNRKLGHLYSWTGDENASLRHNALSVVYHNVLGAEVGADLAMLAHQRQTMGDRTFRRRLRAVLDPPQTEALMKALDED